MLFISKKLVNYLLPAISGILTGAALTTPYSFLGFVSLVPLLLFLAKEKSLFKIFLGSWIYGIIFWGFLVQWIFKFLPLDWAGFSPTSGLFFVTVSWGITAIGMGISAVIFGVTIKKILDRHLFFLLFPGVFMWVAGEYLNSWFLMSLWAGAETSIEPITLGHIGYILADFPSLLKLASVGSIYLLSAVVFIFNVCVFEIGYWFRGWGIEKNGRITQTRFFPIIFYGASITSILLVFYAIWPQIRLLTKTLPHRGHIRIALVSSNIPSWSEIRQAEHVLVKKKLLGFLRNLSKEDFDIVIFPESARVSTMVDPQTLSRWLEENNAILVDNTLGRNKSDTKLRSKLLVRGLKHGGKVVGWDKTQLMMAGEYPPLILIGIAKLFGFKDVLARYETNTYQPGNHSEYPIPVRGTFAGISLCTQIWAPQFFWDQRLRGASFLINLSSDALFHGSKSYPMERLRMLKVRAVENRSFVFQATNAGASLVINPNGEISKTAETKTPISYAYAVFELSN